MYEQNISDIAGQARSSKVFQGFKDHFSGHRASSELTMLEVLRKVYPELNIVCAVPLDCDLFGYARAGQASTIRDSDKFFDATRI